MPTTILPQGGFAAPPFIDEEARTLTLQMFNKPKLVLTREEVMPPIVSNRDGRSIFLLPCRTQDEYGERKFDIELNEEQFNLLAATGFCG